MTRIHPATLALTAAVGIAVWYLLWMYVLLPGATGVVDLVAALVGAR